MDPWQAALTYGLGYPLKGAMKGAGAVYNAGQAAYPYLQALLSAGSGAYGAGKASDYMFGIPSQGKRKPTKKISRRKMPYGRRRTRLRGRLRSGRTKTRTKRRKRRRGLSRRGAAAVKRICRRVARDVGQRSILMEHRKQIGFQLSSNVNSAVLSYVDYMHKNDIMNLVDETIPTIDNGLLDWKDVWASGSTSKIYAWGMMGFEIANNYNYDVRIETALVKCTTHTNDSIAVTREAQLQDDVVDDNLASVTNADNEPAFSLAYVLQKKYNQQWKKQGKIRVVTIPPGTSVKLWYKIPKGLFEVAKSHNLGGLNFYKGFSHQVVFRLRGAVAHGKATDLESGNVGFSDCKVDIVSTKIFKYYVQNSTEQFKVEYHDNLDSLINPEITTRAIEEQTEINS